MGIGAAVFFFLKQAPEAVIFPGGKQPDQETPAPTQKFESCPSKRAKLYVASLSSVREKAKEAAFKTQITSILPAVILTC